MMRQITDLAYSMVVATGVVFAFFMALGFIDMFLEAFFLSM